MSTELLQILHPNVPTYVSLMRKNLLPNTSVSEIKAIVETELEHLNWLAMLNPKIKTCHPESIKNAVRKVIMQNLSLDPDLGLVYLTTRKMAVDGVKVDVLECKASVNGEISLYKQAGSLARVNPPVITYNEVTQRVELVHIELVLPIYNERGNVTGMDTVSFNFTPTDFKRWEKFSHKQNCGSKSANEINNTTLNQANPLYSNHYPLDDKAYHSYDNKGGIDPGFAVSKCFKHALKLAKLDKNPYAKRVLGIVHEKYVDVQHEEVETWEEPIVVPSRDEILAQYQDAEVVPPVPPVPQPAGKSPLFDQIDSCKTEGEVTALYIANQAEISSNPELLAHLKKVGVSRRNNPITINVAEIVAEVNELPSSNDM